MTAILQVAVPAPMHRTFDYLPPAGVDPRTLKPGLRVEVPFGRHRKVGILLRLVAIAGPARRSRIWATSPGSSRCIRGWRGSCQTTPRRHLACV